MKNEEGVGFIVGRGFRGGFRGRAVLLMEFGGREGLFIVWLKRNLL